MTSLGASSKRFAFFTLAMLLCAVARADYGWIPEAKKLQVKIGADFLRSKENLLTDGTPVDILFQGTPAKLTDFKLFVEPEYGIADDFALKLRLNYQSNTLDRQTGTGVNFLSGSGLGDIWASVKWGLKTTLPIITFEAAGKFPTYSMTPTLADELVLGDGNIDFAFFLHTGYKTGPIVLSLSPAFVARFGGYAPQVNVDGAIEFQFARGYVRGIASLITSIGNNLLLDSGINIHNAPGAGNSYLRLSGSPVGFNAGGKIGAIFVPGFMVEGGITQTVAGSRYGNFLSVTADLFMTFDFFEPNKKKKVKEVPLNERPQPFYQDEEEEK